MDITKKLVLTLSIEECDTIVKALAKSTGMSWEQINPVICDFDEQVKKQLKPTEEKIDGTEKNN
jgi:hypothetical protein